MRASWRERLIRPTDIYPEHKVEGHGWLSRIEDGLYEMRSQFCEIETDEGVTGLGAPPPLTRPSSSATNSPRC